MAFELELQLGPGGRTGHAERRHVPGLSTPAELLTLAVFRPHVAHIVDCRFRMPYAYSGNGLTVRIPWATPVVAGGTSPVVFGAAFASALNRQAKVYSYQTAEVLPPGTAGTFSDAVITFTDGQVGIAAGELCTLRFGRILGGNDDLLGSVYTSNPHVIDAG